MLRFKLGWERPKAASTEAVSCCGRIRSMAIDIWADSVQTVAVVAGSAAVLFGYRQARLARHGGGGANVLQLWAFLQSDTARANRRTLYRAFERAGPFVVDSANWTDDELEAAGHVGSTFSVAAALAKRDLVPLELLIDEWGSVLVRTWSIAEPVIQQERRRRRDPNVFSSYQWLAEKATAAHGRFQA